MDTRIPDLLRALSTIVIAGGVVFLIANSIWKAGDAVYQGDLEEEANREIHVIIDGMGRAYVGHINESAGTNLVPMAIASGVCADKMLKADSKDYCLGPWGKDNWILLTSNAGLKDFDNSFNIYMTGLNRDACVNLGMAFAVDSPGLLHALINKSEVFLVGPSAKGPFTGTTVEQACNRSRNQNSLLLTYRLQ